jgi:hypothetical protein
MSGENEVGRIGLIDLTTDDAPAIRDFYKAVVGWDSVDVDMEGHDDYMMTVPATGDAVSGICHARQQCGSAARLDHLYRRCGCCRERGQVRTERWQSCRDATRPCRRAVLRDRGFERRDCGALPAQGAMIRYMP